ncbi:XdhC family protein [Flavobacterium algicola]|uniref:XdhC family protein n=1 Tax=Flavobacterium algicola TaxID=556529 RepID=UPI001EFE18A1|nr:XdhC/CoxI family protein [Flavobacterium algicola]MCG9793848.1 XdhC family protein [Flavobacterium algicola]
MRELDAIISKYNSLKSQDVATVLATVVSVQGSSYRRAGARMLIDEYGNITGAISGGCLEGDALKKALHALHRQTNKLITYDTSDDNDAIIGAQLGCNGIIQVLFEPLNYNDKLNPCELLKQAASIKVELAIVVFFNLDKKMQQIGTSATIDNNSNYTGKALGIEDKLSLYELIQESLTTKKSICSEISLDGLTQQLFIQYYLPPVKLIIVGAGNDAQILAQQAEFLGWDVTITDGRPTHANHERFASSCQVIVSNPEQVLENVDIDNRSCFVLMSHNYNYDLAALKVLLLEEQIPYIGILGPLKKYNRMQDDLRKGGLYLDNSVKDKIHAPIGLEIGAETPAEIGLAILAEIQSVLTNSSGRPLREKLVPIHKESEYLKMQKI